MVPCSHRIGRSGGLAARSGDPAGAKYGNNTQRGDYLIFDGFHEILLAVLQRAGL